MTLDLGGLLIDGGAIDAINVYRRPRPERSRWASVTIWMRDQGQRQLTF